jgi:YHS domain-containing protein
MNAICKSAWTIVLLGMAIGCAGETEPETLPAGAGSGTAKANNPPAGDKSAAPTKPPAAADTKPGEMKKVDDAPAVEGPKADAGTTKLTADELAAIKELPAAEQAVAIQQAVCPVSSHNLGSMEKPIKVTAEGRTFYLCCESCEKELKANPKAVIAKLDKK